MEYGLVLWDFEEDSRKWKSGLDRVLSGHGGNPMIGYLDNFFLELERNWGGGKDVFGREAAVSYSCWLREGHVGHFCGLHSAPSYLCST